MIVDLFLVYQFVRRLATPFDKWDAFKEGVIDKDGKILVKKNRRGGKQNRAFGLFDLMVLNMKKLLGKLPGGSSKIASYAAALFLIKEYKVFTDDSLLNEDMSEEDITESISIFNDSYVNYTILAEDVNLNVLTEAKELPTKPPKFKRAGPDGEIEIKFPSGRKFLIRKQLDQNLDHERGQFQVLEWMARDWEWVETTGPKAYAKELVLKMGMMNKNHTKIIADYSASLTKFVHSPLVDKSGRTINFNESAEVDEATNLANLKLINKIKKSGVVKSGSMSKIDTKPEVNEEPINSVGSGDIAGMDGGHMSKAGQKKWTSGNKSDKKKRLRDIMGVPK